MSATSKVDALHKPDSGKCLARSVAQALAEDPTLEAVTVDQAHHTISVATLGQTDVPKLTERISATVQQAEESDAAQPCTLLAGETTCRTCGQPLSEFERRKITISREAETTTIARVTCPTAPKFWRWRDIPWPKVVQRDVEFLERADEVNEWKAELVAAILCGGLGLGAYLFRTHPVSVIGYVLAYIAGGWFTAQDVWERLRQRAIDVHFLMLAVAFGSASIGAWGEGTTLLFLFSLSGALEGFALGRTQREIRSLFRDAPKVATVLDEEGQEHEVQVEKLRRGMRLLVKPGAQFPVDAELVKGQTASDESNLTGEVAPVAKAIGDTVLAGTINLWGAVEVLVLRPVAESSLQKIIHLIKEAQQRKAPAQQFTDRFSTVYTYSVLGLSLIMFFVWWLGFGQAPFAAERLGHSAFYHAMTLLVVASPCALVLSIPSAVLAAIAWGARHGILFRGGAAVEKLAGVNTVALDKTGTLTTGELRVEIVESFPPGREMEVAQLAFSLERLSTHPLARAFTRHGKQQGLQPLELADFESITGQGLRARRNGDSCLLGRREWLAQSPAAAHIGVAMGARGSDAALEQADVVLMHDRLENFLAAFRLSQRARRVIRQNLVISLGTVVVLVTLAILGHIPLTVGVVGHEGSTVVVVMNSLRLLFGADRRDHESH